MTGTLSSSERSDIRTEAIQTAHDALAEDHAIRVAPLDELLAMDQAELDAYLAERGASVDWEALDHRVLDHLTPSEALAIDRGEQLSQGRLDRVRASAQKALVAIAREQANVLMASEEQAAMFDNDPRAPDEQFGVWCCICSGSCDDCLHHHGEIFRMDMWEGISPEDGGNQCGDRCRCRIMPCADPGAGAEGLRVH